MKRTYNQNQQGAVAIFVVVFAALFITIITVSFVGIMLKNQTQSVNADLADSAYDSALAGVEDAKRLFQQYKNCEAISGFGVGNGACDRAQDAINAGCASTVKFITGRESGEMSIQRNSGASSDDLLNQAYTCVKLNLNVDHRDGTLNAEQFDVIPLNLRAPAGSTATTFNTIQISWFDRADDNANNNAGFYNSPTMRFPAYNAWRAPTAPLNSVPSVLRVQFVGTGGSFNLGDFDAGASPRKTGTTFLYPRSTGVSIVGDLLNPAKLSPIRCVQNIVGTKTYLCRAELQLPVAQPINPPSYLVVSPIYRTTTHYSVRVLSGTTTFNFTNVANVDATGRANDIFRRVQAQIELDTSGGVSSSGYPVAALEVGQLCKNFSVTDRGQDFQYSGCAP